MTLATGQNGDKKLLVIGLEKENINRILQGHPVHIRREVHGEGVPENWEIIITSGTHQEIYDTLSQVGWVDKETEIKVDPRLGQIKTK